MGVGGYISSSEESRLRKLKILQLWSRRETVSSSVLLSARQALIYWSKCNGDPPGIRAHDLQGQQSLFNNKKRELWRDHLDASKGHGDLDFWRCTVDRVRGNTRELQQQELQLGVRIFFLPCRWVKHWNKDSVRLKSSSLERVKPHWPRT